MIKKWPWFLVALFVVVLDQLSKHWMLSHFNLYQTQPLLPMLNLSLTFNTGASFGFLSSFDGWQRWFFAFVSSLISLVLIGWIVRLPQNDRALAFALSLTLGGAIGNLYDRLKFGYVIDFIDVYYKNHHWPTFNLADSAICLGAIILLFCLGKKGG